MRIQPFYIVSEPGFGALVGAAIGAMQPSWRRPGSHELWTLIHPHHPIMYYSPRDPHTFSGGTWALQAYINSLQSLLGSLGFIYLANHASLPVDA